MFGLKKGRNQNMIMLLAVAALIFTSIPNEFQVWLCHR